MSIIAEECYDWGCFDWARGIRSNQQQQRQGRDRHHHRRCHCHRCWDPQLPLPHLINSMRRLFFLPPTSFFYVLRRDHTDNCLMIHSLGLSTLMEIDAVANILMLSMDRYLKRRYIHFTNPIEPWSEEQNISQDTHENENRQTQTEPTDRFWDLQISRQWFLFTIVITFKHRMIGGNDSYFGYSRKCFFSGCSWSRSSWCRSSWSHTCIHSQLQSSSLQPPRSQH